MPLVSHPRVRMVSLTGSIATGKKLVEIASQTMKRTHMELGGKAPGSVLDDANLDEVVAGIRTFGEQLQAEELGLQANQTYYALARERYDQGVDSYLVVLDAQRSLYRARQSVVVIRLARLVNRVNLYKVLGGGWQERS